MLTRSDTNLFIVGAGFAGQMIAQDIARKKIFGKVSAFLDDDKDLIGKKIDGIPVLGPIDDIAPIAAQNAMSEAIIAMPSAPGERIREIYELLKRSGILHIRILPAISQVVSGTAHLCQSRKEKNDMEILEDCILCGACIDACPLGAIYEDEDRVHIDHDKCIDCGSCAAICPAGNISFD